MHYSCKTGSRVYADPHDLIPYKHGELYGYMDREGKVVIKPQYISAGLFDNNKLAAVGKESGEGFIDMQGNELFELVFTHRGTPWYHKPKLAKYRALNGHHQTSKNYGYYYSGDGKKYVIFKREPKIKFSKVYYNQNDKQKPNWQYFPYYLGDFFTGGVCKVRNENGRYNYIDTSLSEIFPADYVDINIVSDSLFSIKTDENKYNLKHINNQDSSKVTYSHIVATTDSKYCIAINGENDTSVLINNDLTTVFSTTGKNSNISYLGYGKLKYSKDNKYGLIDTLGNQLLPPEYHEIETLSDSILIVEKAGYSYLINNEGTFSDPYTNIRNVSRKSYAIGYRDSSIHLLNHRGKTITTYNKEIEFKSVTDGNICILYQSTLTEKLLNQNGELLISDKVVKAHETLAEGVYFITIIEDKLPKKGLYSIADGWISLPQTCEVRHYNIYELDNYRIELETLDSTISYEWYYDFKDYTRTAKSNKKEFLEVFYQDTTYAYYDHNKLIKYRTNASNRPTWINDKFYITHTGGYKQKDLLYNHEMNAVLPFEVFKFSKFNLDDKELLLVEDSIGNGGLFSLESGWIHNMESGQGIFKHSHTLYYLKDSKGYILYDNDHNRLNTIPYKNIDSPRGFNYLVKNRKNFLIGFKSKRDFDIINRRGETIYSGNNYKLIKTNDQYIFVEGKNEGQLCLLDTIGNVVFCDTYSEVQPVGNRLFIVKKESSYGIVNLKNELLVPIKFKTIKWLPEMKSFALCDQNSRVDIINTKGDVTIKGLKNPIRLRACDTYNYHYIQGKKLAYIINKEGILHQTFEAEIKGCHILPDLKNKGIVRLRNDLYGDLNTGRLYR